MKWSPFYAALWLCAACRPDAGPSDYKSQETFAEKGDDAGSGPEFLPGPNPYQPGKRRLSIGVFYEGGRSEEVAVDNMVTHFYVYENTFAIAPDTDRIEGLASDRVEHAGGPWWGGGVTWDVPRDLSPWKAMHIALQSDAPGFADVDLSMSSGEPVKVSAASYGYKNDGKWHSLTIPLSDFVAQGLDLTMVTSPLVVGGGTAKPTEVLRIDDVYFDTEPPKGLNRQLRQN